MKITKKLLALVLVLTMTLGLGVTANAASDDKPILALGADLSTDQRAAVLGLLGVDESDLANYDVISITNAEEHQYLDAYLSSSVIGTHALSSVLIRPAEEGAGLNVTTYNISYCTIDMYTNALLTAGLQDANVFVAAPSNISGTSVEIMETSEYGDSTDIRSIIEGDRRFKDDEDSYGDYGFSKQEFAEDGELVDIEEEPDDSDEDFSDFDGDFEEE